MTIDEAKKLYIHYDCSLFAMAREDKKAYEDYKALNLPRTIEEEWSREFFFILYEQLKATGDSAVFNKMYHIADKLHDKESLVNIKEALSFIRFDDIENRLSIAEAVIGRKDITARSGMIFWAYDLGDKELATELMQYVINLLNNKSNDNEINSRVSRDVKKCVMIDTLLNLGICNDGNI